ncbi:MAG: bifunctional tetrahydrofolate synthase/dihydrofolate synthase [Sulfuricellaceae bacterium]|jgi:dihydrofolate synthase/folylpolyglutamate synthase
MPDTLAGWLSYLEGLHPKTIDLGLERVAAVKSRLGLVPAFPLVTVGGTNGKGSTCAFLEAIFAAAGYRVGLYTSPHLLRYNERVRVAGREADDDALCRAFAAVEAARGKTALTYFEFGTLAAMWHFMQQGVDVAVLEVGLGGRLDAVNVFDPDCAVVTGVAIDHTDYLGDDRESIGFEKAGIYRAGRPAVCADPDPPASLVRHAEAIGAKLWRIGREFSYQGDGGAWDYASPAARRKGLPRPALAGSFQLNNGAAALAALDALAERLPVGEGAIAEGLRAARVAGRFQVLPGKPPCIVDVAHNPQSAAALADNLRKERGAGRTLAVFAMLGDKDIGGVAAALQGQVDHWLVAGLDVPRGAPAEALAEALAKTGGRAPVELCGSVAEAYRRACELAGEGDRIAAFGSFYTAAAVLALRAGVTEHGSIS